MARLQCADGLRGTEFVYLLTDDTRYRDKVRDILIQHTGIAGTDFSNGVKWPRTYVWHSKDFEVVNWLRKPRMVVRGLPNRAVGEAERGDLVSLP